MDTLHRWHDAIADGGPPCARRLAMPCFVMACVLHAVCSFFHFRERMPTWAAVKSSMRSMAAPWSSCTTWAAKNAAARPYDRLKSAALATQEWDSRLRGMLPVTFMWMHLLVLRMAGLALFGEAVVWWAPYTIDFYACFIWFTLAAGGVLFSRRLTPALVDALFVINCVVMVLKLNFIAPIPEGSTYITVQAIRLLFSFQMESVPVILLTNVGFSVHWYVHWQEMARDEGRWMNLITDGVIIMLGVVAAVSLKRRRAQEARCIVDSLWSHRQLTAAHAMLHATCDVVLDLDEELRYVSDEGGRMLAAFLLRSPQASMFKEGGAFSAVLSPSERTRFEDLFAPQAGDQPVVKLFNGRLQDGNGSALPVEILTVACESCTFLQGFLVGIRENSDGRQQRARPNSIQDQHVPCALLDGAAVGVHCTMPSVEMASASSSPSALSSATPQSGDLGPSSTTVAAQPAASSTGASLAADGFHGQLEWRLHASPGERRPRRRSPTSTKSPAQPMSTSARGARASESPISSSSSGSAIGALGAHPTRRGDRQQQQQQQQQQPTPEVEEQRLQGQHELDP